jgi:menaquinol-cytochrome c reductase cytochrome b/c subunit
VFAFLTIFSMIVNAPLRELANSNLTPNPSKAPWYFLGLQELLRYFHPMVAGVTIPTVGLLGLMATPYFDRNPSMRPENRKLAILMFTMFLMFWAVLVIAGSFFRGPSFEWAWPWTQNCSTPVHPDSTCLFFEF